MRKCNIRIFGILINEHQQVFLSDEKRSDFNPTNCREALDRQKGLLYSGSSILKLIQPV